MMLLNASVGDHRTVLSISFLSRGKICGLIFSNIFYYRYRQNFTRKAVFDSKFMLTEATLLEDRFCNVSSASASSAWETLPLLI